MICQDIWLTEISIIMIDHRPRHNQVFSEVGKKECIFYSFLPWPSPGTSRGRQPRCVRLSLTLSSAALETGASQIITFLIRVAQFLPSVPNSLNPQKLQYFNSLAPTNVVLCWHFLTIKEKSKENAVTVSICHFGLAANQLRHSFPTPSQELQMTIKRWERVLLNIFIETHSYFEPRVSSIHELWGYLCYPDCDHHVMIIYEYIHPHLPNCDHHRDNCNLGKVCALPTEQES